VKKLVIFILGPTAVGKTAVAIQLAKKIKAEIISCDSMQVYRGINILSSKPSLVQRSTIKHHLIDVADPDQDFDVAQYVGLAASAIDEILSKDKAPLVVGGTGFYAGVLIDGIFADNNKNPLLRENLFQEADEFGSEFLHSKLQRLDKKSALNIHPNDTKRIVRALEVCLTHQDKFSELRKNRSGIGSKYALKMFGLNMSRGLLYEKIEKRVEEMFKQGAVQEVQNLLNKPLSQAARMCLGIREIKDYLENRCSLYETTELIKKNSRNYAKRQLTWFRKDKRIKWLDVSDLSTEDIVEQLVRELS
jgi:tRNA dimethylallyltransferase